ADFFFQAEDGIRVFHVTGVQTCALPICPNRPGVEQEVANRINAVTTRSSVARMGTAAAFGDQARSHTPPPTMHGATGLRTVPCRSEERRVGKECRPRRTPAAHDSSARRM